MYVWREEMLSACAVTPEDGILVALSGGADSVALLLESIRWKNENRIKRVTAAHFHHGIRGTEADRDAAFCKALCEKCNVPYLEGRADIPTISKDKGLSLETAAREERYRFLRDAMETEKLSCIAVAHHKDDQAETLLLHLIRGSGLEGLCGMQPRCGDLIRPLLPVSKSEILDFLAERGQPYCRDSTNESEDAARNKLRLSVMPLLRALNPRVTDALCRTAVYLQEDAVFLNEHADRLYETEQSRYSLSQLPPALRLRVLRRYLPYSDFDRHDLETLDSLLTAKTGTERNLKDGYRAWTDLDTLRVEPIETVSYSFPLTVGAFTALPNGQAITVQLVEEASFPCKPSEAYIDAAAVEGKLYVRTPKDGDRFTPFGMHGTKLLSDYFTDRKVPRFQRSIPLVCDGRGIVFVAGYTVDERMRIRSSSVNLYHIILKEADSYVG